MKDILKGKKTFLNKIAEEMAIASAVRKEKYAETKLSLILEEIAVALKTKGIKEWNGDNYTLTIS
jgi:hypothetical protein